MLRNYIKIALRLFRKDTTFPLINVAGLATGLAVAMRIFRYVRFELSDKQPNPPAGQIVPLTMTDWG